MKRRIVKYLIILNSVLFCFVLVGCKIINKDFLPSQSLPSDGVISSVPSSNVITSSNSNGDLIISSKADSVIPTTSSGIVSTTPTPAPTPTPSVSTTPTPTPSVSTTPTPTPSVSTTPTPTPTPTPSVSTTPTPTPSVSTTPTPTPTPKPTPTPSVSTSVSTSDIIYYTITFIVDNDIYKEMSIKEHTTLTLPSNPYKEGYEFIGWYTDKSYTNSFNVNDSITSNLVLYAKFKENIKDDNDEDNKSITVTFVVDKNNSWTENISYNSKVDKPSDPILENYSFVGWFESLDDENSFDFTIQITSNLTLYAKFLQLSLNELEAVGYEEGFYAYFEETNPSSVKAYYKLSSSSTWNAIDSELIRQETKNITRVDMVGLSSNNYDVKVITSKNKTLLYENIKVTSYDRSGYAHFNTSGVGAYNDDGTLKSNAQVIYVTEKNKNSITCQIGNKTYTGIAQILQNQYKSNNPLCVRILGQVSADMWSSIEYKKGSGNLSPSDIKGKNGVALECKNYDESEIIEAGFNNLEGKYEQIKGLTNKVKYDSSKKEFDSYYNMLDVSMAKNVTVEGIGSNALIYQWGFTWSKCSYIEVRNLTFDDAPEDACSFEGGDDSTTFEGFKTGHIWIHNNTFNEGNNNWDVCNEQDKHEGDGATDFKKNAYITVSYNHYFKNHKTGLVGGSDSQHTACVTYHHNYYESNSSRLPLARQANMHMYNNYYYGSTGTNMSLRAGAYALIEGCYFENVSNPIEVKDNKSAAKVYNSEFKGCKGSNNGTVVSSRDAIVKNENIYSQTFDTDSSIFYYNSITKTSNVKYITDALQAKKDCLNLAGTLKEVDYKFNNSSNDNDSKDDSNDNTSGDNDNSNDNTSGDNDNSNDNESGNINGNYTYTFNDLTNDSYKSNIEGSDYIIYAKADKTVSIAECNYAYKGITFNKVLKTGGSGKTDYRSVGFKITKACKLTVYFCSDSDKDNRGCKILDSSGVEVAKSELVGSKAVYEYTYNITVAGTYYITSQNSSISIFGYTLTY